MILGHRPCCAWCRGQRWVGEAEQPFTKYYHSHFTDTEAEAPGGNHRISRSFDSKRSPQNFPSYLLTEPLLANGLCYSVASGRDRLSWSRFFLAIRLFSILHLNSNPLSWCPPSPGLPGLQRLESQSSEHDWGSTTQTFQSEIWREEVEKYSEVVWDFCWTTWLGAFVCSEAAVAEVLVFWPWPLGLWQTEYRASLCWRQCSSTSLPTPCLHHLGG